MMAERPSWAIRATSTVRYNIDIIVQQPSCHRFIARHLYNFFVADEAQVPACGMTTPPRDPGGCRYDSQGLRGLAL